MQHLEPGTLILTLAGVGAAAAIAVAVGRGIASMFLAASVGGDDKDK